MKKTISFIAQASVKITDLTGVEIMMGEDNTIHYRFYTDGGGFNGNLRSTGKVMQSNIEGFGTDKFAFIYEDSQGWPKVLWLEDFAPITDVKYGISY